MSIWRHAPRCHEVQEIWILKIENVQFCSKVGPLCRGIGSKTLIVYVIYDWLYKLFPQLDYRDAPRKYSETGFIDLEVSDHNVIVPCFWIACHAILIWSWHIPPPCPSPPPPHQYILCCSEVESLSSLRHFMAVGGSDIGSFWVFLEYSPNIRNLTTASNVIADVLPIQRLVSFYHLFRRHGMEEYHWPENAKHFNCQVTLGTICGVTAFSMIAFALLATCVCGWWIFWKSFYLCTNRRGLWIKNG